MKKHFYICILAFLLVACGEATSQPVSPATVAPAIAGSQATPASGGTSAVLPADGNLTGDLAVLDRVLKASSTFSSVKMAITSQGVGVDGTIVVVKPESFSLAINNNGQKQNITVVGSDAFIGQSQGDNINWVRAPATNYRLSQVLDGLNQSSLEQLKKLAGSRFTVLPDEKLNGKDVGVLEVDTASLTAPDTTGVKGTKFQYRYDKQDFRLQQVQTRNGGNVFEVNYQDYDSPNNKVTAPTVNAPGS